MENSSRKRLIEIMTDELPVLRAKLGISQGELAASVGISRQTYSAVETGKQPMSWVTFMALLAFFENNKETLSVLSTIGFFNDHAFAECLYFKKER